MSSSSVDEQIDKLGRLLEETGAIGLQIVAVAEFDPSMMAAVPGVNQKVKDIHAEAKNATKAFVRKREEKVQKAIQMCEAFADLWIPLIAKSKALHESGML